MGSVSLTLALGTTERVANASIRQAGAGSFRGSSYARQGESSETVSVVDLGSREIPSSDGRRDRPGQGGGRWPPRGDRRGARRVALAWHAYGALRLGLR